MYWWMSRVLHVYGVVWKGGEICGVRLLASRCETFEGIQYVLTSMRDDPVTGDQSVTKFMLPNTNNVPYLCQSFVHRPLLCLLDGNLKSLGFAGTFWVGWRITNGTVRSCIHIGVIKFCS
jgi:hypothetical protein